MTTTLLSLRSQLQTTIGDKNQVYADNYTDALNTAKEQIYPNLFRYIDNTDLVTGNILPPFNWSTTALLNVYTEPTGTLLKTTDGTYIWRGSSSAKVTASDDDDSIVLDSNVYPRLLDLMDKTVILKCWVYPEIANDAFIDIVTTDSAGTDTTESSTTACPANAHTLLEIEDYSVPDDIVRIRINLRVHTDTEWAYFDQPRLTGKDVREYLLPSDAQDGVISRVSIQISGYSDDACDDLHPAYWQEVFDYYTIDDGTYKYLRLPVYSTKTQIRLIGYYPLETLTADTSTISLDGEKLNLLTAYAAYLLFEIENGSITSDIGTTTSAIATVDTEIATEDTAISAVATDIASVISSIDTTMATVENVASEDISRYDAKIGRLDSKKKRLEDKRDALQDKRARLIVEKNALDEDIKRLDDKRARAERESYKWLAKYRMLLPELRMVTPRMSMKLRSLDGS